MSKKGGVISVVIIASIFYLALFGYSELTKHTITVKIDSAQIVPVKGGDGSAYLIHVGGERGQIELQRAWYMWGDNIDTLHFNLQKKQGKTVTLECFGWDIPAIYWYSQCYKEV